MIGAGPTLRILNRSSGIKESAEDIVKRFGYTLQQLSEDTEARRTFNIKSLKEWEDNYVYHGNSLFKTDLW